MKHVQRLRLEPRPSRIARAAIVIACSATGVLITAMRLPLAATVGCVAILLLELVSGLRQCSGRGVPALLHVGIDRRITVTDRNGRSHAGAILDDSYVGSALTTVVWRADGEHWWRPARTMLFVADSLPRDEFRRLRVVLRYGCPLDDAATSGVDAG